MNSLLQRNPFGRYAPGIPVFGIGGIAATAVAEVSPDLVVVAQFTSFGFPSNLYNISY